MCVCADVYVHIQLDNLHMGILDVDNTKNWEEMEARYCNVPRCYLTQFTASNKIYFYVHITCI